MVWVVLSLIALICSLAALSRALLDHLTQKRQIADFQKRLVEAEKLLSRRGNLANEIAHEIKNPITAILCCAEALQHLLGKNIEESHHKSLQYIKEYGDHLLHLVSDFLDLSRAEAGLVETRLEPVSISNICESIVGLLQAFAIKKKITLTNYSVKENLMGYADQKHLKQILFNLVHNAIKFTPEGGEVHLMVRTDFPKPFICITVMDSGTGILATELPYVFDPYARFEREAAPQDTGAGLGLALCKSLVELGGGTIAVESCLGVGSSFEFTVPVYVGQEKNSTPDSTTEKETTGRFSPSSIMQLPQPLLGQSFLVVDENTGSREAISTLIAALGGAVDQVQDSVSALEAIARKEYDAVMVDDSQEKWIADVHNAIKQDGRGPDTTLILATGHEVDDKFMDLHPADRYLEKPFNGELLLRSLLNSGKFTITH